MTERRQLPAGAVGLAILTVAFGIGSVLVGYANGSKVDITAAALVTFLAFPAMGLLILRHVRSHPIGWLLVWIGADIYFTFVSSGYAELAVVRKPGILPLGQVVAWSGGWLWIPFALMVLVFTPMLFPDGRLLSPRWRLVVGAGFVFAALAFLGNAFAPGPVYTDAPGVNNPLGLPQYASVLGALRTASLPFGVFALIGSIVSVVVRYRRADSLERRQLRWFLAALIVAAVPFALQGNVPAPVAQAVVTFTIPLLPISIAIAVLRYRLYDIDLVINRALVYGVLAAFITAVYVAIVVGIGNLIGSGDRPNLLLSILATAVVAVAFQPVRTWVQALANRLVYGYRATPYEALTQFSHRVAGAYADEDVLPRLARVLAEGTGASATGVWIRAGGEAVAAAAWPANQTAVPLEAADLVAEVRHLGEALGALAVRKRQGEPLTPVERKLVNDLAAQAGQVLRNARLTSELQGRLEEISAQAMELRASRQRIVAAQDTERQRLERNIHDGAQQHLVALAVKLRLASALARRDPVKARRSVEELKAQAADALQTLRDLAQGIYPPALRDGGLVEALRPHAPVTAEGVGRYHSELEAGVYFCCLEAIQNATKYARASQLRVELRQQNGQLAFAVTDDGVGFDPSEAAAGRGVQNMKDRIGSLGGHLSLESEPGKGTKVSGVLPLSATAIGLAS